VDLDKRSGLCAGVPPIIGPKFSQIGETVRVLSPKNAKSHRPPANYRKSLERSRVTVNSSHTQRVRSRSEDRRARPGGGSRSSSAPTTAAGSLSVAADGPPGRPQNVGQRHVSPSAAHRSAFRTVSRILVTTSGELILLPVGGRHPILNLGRRPLARYSDFDIPPSSSRTYPAYSTLQVLNGG